MNRTLKYLLNNIRQNSGLIIVFTLIMIIQLLLTSELWFKYYPTGKKALSQACYSFEIEDFEKEDVLRVMVDYPKSMVKPLDVQLVGMGEQNHPELISENKFDETNPEYLTLMQDMDDSYSETVRIYAAITSLSERRINDVGSYDRSKLRDNAVVLLPMRFGVAQKKRSEFDVGKYAYVLGNSLEIVGVADIYEVSRAEYAFPFEYIGNINTVLKLTSKHEIVFQFEKPLKSEEESRLIAYVVKHFTVTSTKGPYVLEQDQLESLKRLTTISTLGIILCFWLTIEFIWYVLECRRKEFRVYQICGATEKHITKMILIHISILCFISECLGWGVFCLLQKFTMLIQLDNVPWLFALINILLFWIIAMIVVSLNLAIEALQKKKLGISRTAR